MALKLYVRGAAGAVAVKDLGITVAQGPSWTQLNYSSPADAEGDSGQFTARELRDSGDLFDLISGGTLEWSKDGATVEAAGDYKADYMITEDFTDDFFDLSDGGLALPQGTSTPASGVEGQVFWDTDDDMPYYWDGSAWVSTAVLLSGVMDHEWLLNIGTNSHTDIDSHIADSTIHFTEGSIDHGSISGLGDDDHTQYLLLGGDLSRNIVTGGADFSTASGLIVPQGTGTSGQTPTEGNLFWDTDDDALYMYDGSQWITIATSSGINTDHGALTGLLDDDHTQYLNETRHDALPADNPHSVTFTQAVTADSGTDITAAEAETLTDGSNADSLHEHDHGALSGLDDDDHSQYLLLSGNGARNAVTGTIDMSAGDELLIPQHTNIEGNLVGHEGAIAWDTDDDIFYVHDGTSWIGIAPASGIITEHGLLTGLGDDDHPQYTQWVHDETISGVWTFDPADTDPNFILDPRSSAPSNNLVDGAIANVGGILYAYDTTRSKWLSVDRVSYNAGRRGAATNIYMRLPDGIATSTTGIRMLRNGTIVGLAAQTESSASWTFEIHRNDASIATLVISGAIGGQATNINVDVSQGDEIQFYCNGTAIPNPIGLVEIAWRV